MTRIMRPTSFLLLVAALAACSDAPDRLAGPRSTGVPVFAAGQGGGNGKSSLDLVEEDYAAGALDKENANRYRAYAVLAPEKLPGKYKSAVIGKDATESMCARRSSSTASRSRRSRRSSNCAPTASRT